MAAYRKKHIFVDAEQWFPGRAVKGVRVEHYATQGQVTYPERAVCDTLEGPVEVYPGDWIIRSADQDCYPCHPDIFGVLYEAVAS